ncbi:MAG: SIMPL domain-containing protein [Acidobacteria bacterium]|nr:SIMPL domain-containing protein [Acidobacteriota bacterium]MDA1236588.1 SIMPL domain-containing protein [Acidobacteriota bacterium]
MVVTRRVTVWTFCCAAAVGSLCSVASARDIRVQGQAEVQVRPDHVVLQLGVETWNRELPEAREENDRNVASVREAARILGIAGDDIAVDFAHVEIQRSQQLRTVVDHYTVQRTVVLTLRDVDKFEDTLMSALDAGANYIHNIDFRTSELRKYADQARALALQAAYEKAQDLASVGGFSVSERPSDVFSAETKLQTWYEVGGGNARRSRGQPSVMQNISVSYADSTGQSGQNWSIPNSGVGYLAVQATLDLEFEIEEPGE